jgi:hypothetical protein
MNHVFQIGKGYCCGDRVVERVRIRATYGRREPSDDSSNGLDETTVSLRSWTSTVGISLPPLPWSNSGAEKLLRAFLSDASVPRDPFVNLRGWCAVDQQTQ